MTDESDIFGEDTLAQLDQEMEDADIMELTAADFDEETADVQLDTAADSVMMPSSEEYQDLEQEIDMPPPEILAEENFEEANEQQERASE